MANKYVTVTGGAEPHDGSVGNEWTLAEAQAAVVAGDIILMATGEYGAFTEDNVAHTGYITYKNGVGQTPVLSRIELSGADDLNKYLIFDGLTINHVGVPDAGSVKMQHGKYIKLLNLHINGTGYFPSDSTDYNRGIVLSNMDTVDIDNCIITGPGDRMSGFLTGFYQYSCSNLTLQNCTISNCGTGIDIYHAVNFQILNNAIHCLSSDGIIFGDVQGLTIQGNTVYDIDNYHVTLAETPTTTTWNAGGTIMTGTGSLWKTAGVNLVSTASPGSMIKIVSGTHVTVGAVYWVASVDSDTQLTLDSGCAVGGTPENVDYIIISGVHTDHLQATGNDNAETSSNVTIRNNIFYNTNPITNGQLLWINPINAGAVSGFNWLIENNLVYVANYINGVDEQDNGIINIGAIDGAIVRNNTFIGNLMIGINCLNMGIYSNIASIMSTNEALTSETVVCDYNIVNRGDNWGTYDRIGANTTWFHQSYGHANWRDAEFTDIFTDFDTNDFTLAAGIAIDTGDPVNSATTDILGATRDASPDIGAYEYVSATQDAVGNATASASMTGFAYVNVLPVSGSFSAESSMTGSMYLVILLAIGGCSAEGTMTVFMFSNVLPVVGSCSAEASVVVAADFQSITGSMSAIATMLGDFGSLPTWIQPRRGGYSPDKFWDEKNKTLHDSRPIAKQGGGRHKSFLIVVSDQNKIYVGGI